jgi:hypothetical protein
MTADDREKLLIKIAAVFFLLLIVAYCAGCSTVKPVPQAPDVRPQDVYKEVPCIIQIEEIQCAELPQAQPRESFTDLKAWAKEVRRVIKLREVILKDCIDALRHQISEHNKLEPQCSE